MLTVSECLSRIMKAVRGAEVRQSIHDAIKQCYADATGNPESVAGYAQKVDEYKQLVDEMIKMAETDMNVAEAAELLDIRERADGVIAASAGEAVRGQVSELTQSFNELKTEYLDVMNDLNDEVIDARIGADGVTYGSLGEAIRTQLGLISSELTAITTTEGF